MGGRETFNGDQAFSDDPAGIALIETRAIDVSGQGDIFLYFRFYAPTQDYVDKTCALPHIERIR